MKMTFVEHSPLCVPLLDEAPLLLEVPLHVAPLCHAEGDVGEVAAVLGVLHLVGHPLQLREEEPRQEGVRRRGDVAHGDAGGPLTPSRRTRKHSSYSKIIS